MAYKRDIVIAIILSIITCGIYGIYWFIKLTDGVNYVSGTPNDTSGAAAFLFSIITCGLYGIYWSYKMGCKLDNLEGTSFKGILFLVLTILGFGIVNYIIIQDSLNKR